MNKKMETELLEKLDEFERISSTISEKACFKKKLPETKLYPRIDGQKEILRKLCEEALSSKIDANQLNEAKSRLEWELAAINRTNMEFIFLYVRDILRESDLNVADISARGTWAGSLVAYLVGISEINPLEANLAPEFIFGINGDKEIDIDINVPEYLHDRRFEVCRKLAGVGTVLAAGTLGTWSKDSINRFLDGYELTHHVAVPQEIRNKYQESLDGKYKSRGCHPSGVVLIPEGCDVEEWIFTVSHMDSINKTACEYHDIDNTFLKLDLLKHRAIEQLKTLEELTDVEIADVPYMEDDVLELFVVNGDISASKELYDFDSDFTQGILKATNAKTFKQLAKVVALSHGTGAWLENADELIKDGVSSIDEIIACREDVFDYCISLGIDRETAFQIAEAVRKGRVSSGSCKYWDEWKDIMLKAGAKEWYVESCEKIRYLFPRAHAISYLTMVLRLGWYKVHYPDYYDLSEQII